jgi:VanZ family protein
MRSLFSFRILYTYTIFIVVISVIPVNTKSVDFIPFLDKITHFLIYTTLAFLAINTFRLNLKRNCYIRVFLYCFFVGFAIECIQYFLPYRSFEVFDILANSLGAVSGMFIRLA